MKTTWDYTHLAEAYLKRPDYSREAIDDMIARSGLQPGDPVCDIGAGVGHLTLHHIRHKLDIVAVEPNDAMRALGTQRTADYDKVRWQEATGEATGQADGAFKLASFGSSFNVTDRQVALAESARILKDGGWFACMWNHRDLEDPIQDRIESTIKSQVDEYAYGTRREDQAAEIDRSGLFGEVARIEGQVQHEQTVVDCLEAWRSHATLARQAGDRFAAVIDDIEKVLADLGSDTLMVPYTTRIWLAQKQ